jgi:hypothetical protein
MTSISCYISCIDDIVHYEEANNLAFNFKSSTILSRNDWMVITKHDLYSIMNSDVFIAFISSNYASSKIAKKEFKYAVKTCNKPVICFIKTEENRNRDFDHFLKYAKSIILLPDDYSLGHKWKESILMELKLNIMNLKKDDRIKCLETRTVEDILFLRGTCMQNNQLAIIGYNRYYDDFYIYIYNVNSFKLNKTIKTKDYSILKPSLILSNKSSELLITDTTNGHFYILKSDFKSQPKMFDFNLKRYSDMCLDDLTNDIYFVNFFGRSEIKIVNYDENRIYQIFKDDLKDFKPFRIKVVDDQIIILNACSLRINLETRDLIKTAFGGSFIYIFNKHSKEINLKIDLEENGFYQPWCLFVRKNAIYTTALQCLDTTISNERILLKIQNEHLTPIQIEKINEEIPNDSCLFTNNNRLVILKEESINFYLLK